MRTTISSLQLDRSVPLPGETLDGQYLVDGRCRSNGSVVVLWAKRLPRGEPVTLEMLLPAWAAQDIVVERFLRDGEAAMRVRSEHAVRVLDRGQLRDGEPYLVREHVEGRSLEEVVSSWGRLPAPTVVDWVLQAVEAIAQAHSYDVVLDGLTPAAIFLTRRLDGRPWIKVSLGPARLAEPQVSPTNVDGDIRALGTLLAFLLTGGSAPGGLESALAGSAVPGPLALAVRRCLGDSRHPRFATVAELARALAPFGTTAARVSCERIECLLDDRVSELTRPKARPDHRRPELPSDSGRRGRPLADPASGRVVVVALAMLATLGAIALGWMYMSVPRAVPPSLGVAAMQPAAGSAPPASRTVVAPEPPPTRQPMPH